MLGAKQTILTHKATIYTLIGHGMPRPYHWTLTFWRSGKLNAIPPYPRFINE